MPSKPCNILSIGTAKHILALRTMSKRTSEVLFLTCSLKFFNPHPVKQNFKDAHPHIHEIVQRDREILFCTLPVFHQDHAINPISEHLLHPFNDLGKHRSNEIELKDGASPLLEEKGDALKETTQQGGNEHDKQAHKVNKVAASTQGNATSEAAEKSGQRPAKKASTAHDEGVAATNVSRASTFPSHLQPSKMTAHIKRELAPQRGLETPPPLL